MVTAGHHGAVQGFFTDPLRALLDGSLAPLRNVHKFDVVIRLPLVLGLGLAVDRLLGACAASSGSRDLQHQLDRTNRQHGPGDGSARGAWPPRRPSSWVGSSRRTRWSACRATGTKRPDWLAQHDQDGTALLTPGTGFGDYLWGSPKDEPLQFLARSPWAVRNTIPLAPAGNIRMLDAVEDRFAQGRGSPGMAEYLRRSGIGYLVVRNDLRPGDDVPEPVLVHQAIADSPGLERVGHLRSRGGRWRLLLRQGDAGRDQRWLAGPLPGGRDLRRTRLRHGLGRLGPHRGGRRSRRTCSTSQDLGVIGREPVVLGSDVTDERGADQVPAPFVLTDGLRRAGALLRPDPRRLLPGAHTRGRATRDERAPGLPRSRPAPLVDDRAVRGSVVDLGVLVRLRR